MKKTKNRIATISIAILLTISIGASMILVPNASAHTPAWQIPTYAYVEGTPNPIGVNQTSMIYMWLDAGYDSIAPTNNYRWHDFTLTITAPDDTTTSQTFAVVSDPASNQGYTFIPTQVGTYTLKFTFPGQTLTSSNDNPTSAFINDTYLPSQASATLTVQQTPIATTPSAPLPTTYWMRPIYGENTNWYTISSNWLGLAGYDAGSNAEVPPSGASGYGSDFPGDAVGPQTSHVMWTEPLQSGGVVGGNNFALPGDTYFQGSNGEDRFINPIILDGMLYYTEPLSVGTPNGGSNSAYGPTDCVNLQTGQLVWSRSDVPALSFGYIYDVQTPNQHGVFPPMLIASNDNGISVTWQAYDADTGDFLFNVTNIPQGGTSAIGVNGEYLMYFLANDGTPTNPQYYLGQWNSSNLWQVPLSESELSLANYFEFRPTVPTITDGSNPILYDWNISIPSLDTQTTTPTILDAFSNNMLICLNGTLPIGFGAQLPVNLGGPAIFPQLPYTYFAVNLNATRGTIGSILWTNTVQPPAGNQSVLFIGADPTADGGAGVFVEYNLETVQWVGYSMATGERLWGPVGNETGLSYYNNDLITTGQMAQCAYGKLYTCGYGGLLYCYDLTSGKLLWTYGNGGSGNSTNSGEPYPGSYPIAIYAIGNGIVYLENNAHTYETPLYKGALTRALNATTGQEIWTLSAIDSESSRGAIADGFATFFNGYDNSVYSVGHGPSATTVQAPLTAISAGTSAIIQGTVMDISAGTQQTEQKADFPNGVPASSDASMTAWMGYVYQQQPEPTNFTGVTVTLTAIDPNGNYITLGSATTDASGHFIYMWTPPNVPGKYTVTATFAGTNGYWGSNDETGMVVQGPSAAAPTPVPVSGLATMSALTIGIAAAVIAIIIAIAIVGLLILRKKP